MNLTHSEDLIIKSFEVDEMKNLKPYAFMNLAQEMANIHASMIGFGYDDLILNNLAWVLSRLKVRYIRSPKWREKVIFKTWHKGPEGLFSLRDFVMKSGSGETLITATSYWLIINLDTRRVQRTDHIPGYSDLGVIHRKDAMEDKCDKLSAPINAEMAQKHNVLFSDIDMNSHTNNAKYIEWAMDCIDPALLEKSEINEFQINFNNESKLNDIVELNKAQISEKEFYIEGKSDGKSTFQTQLVLK